MATRSATATTYEDPSHYLSSSISSLSSQRAQSSWIAKTYRHAAQLFLTRRLAEALGAIEPVVYPEEEASRDEQGNGEARDNRQPAPVAASSRGTRVKVWSFYLTLLNAIIELGPEEGKLTFGSSRWRALAAKAKDGTIWEDVIRFGYGGVEGDLDGEVVANLATLLLTHMSSQKLNQQRLENYLSASSNPSFDIAAHMEAAKSGRPNLNRANSHGTSTPRDLNTRLKLLELYTLHVLPRNEEWDYAREFINISEVLDDERREAFQHALQSLKEEKNYEAIREAELKKRQQEELQKRRQDEERRRTEEAQAEEQRRRQEGERRRRATTGSSNASSHDKRNMPNGYQANGQDQHNSKPSSSKNRRGPQEKGSSPPASLYHRASSAIASLHNSLLQARLSAMQNPMAMMRLMFFLLAFVMAFARQDVRARIRRMANEIWNRMRRTIGMGVKVSYL